MMRVEIERWWPAILISVSPWAVLFVALWLLGVI